MRVAIVGCGGMGRAHLADLLQMRKEGYDVEVPYLVDVSEDAARRLRSELRVEGAEVVTDYRKVLGRVDAAVIATPHAHHYRQVIDFLEGGAHVLVEKPMACSLREAVGIYEKWRETGLVVEVGYQRHFQPPFLAARDLVARGEIGRVRLVLAALGQNWLRMVRGTWRTRRELGCGGEFIDSGSHIVDVVLWVTGLRAEEVFARFDRYGEEVDINAAVVARLSGGALFQFTVAGDDPTGWLEAELFWGEGGRLALWPPRVLLCRWGEREREVDTRGYPSSKPVRNFVRAVLGLEENGAPPTCGLRVAELTEAAYRSEALGRPVEVAELYEEMGVPRPP